MYPIDYHYQAPDPTHITGRSDSAENERFFQQLNCIDLNSHTQELKQNAIICIAFYCDEGVKRNFGRTGSAEGPDNLLAKLAKLPTHHPLSIQFIGGIRCQDGQLELAQLALGKLVEYFKQLGHKTLLIGGGHEIAWGHYLGLSTHYPELSIINFDAHFDLRPLQPQANSGTPFLQIAHDKKAKQQTFHYHCLGIQPSANTASLFETAKTLNVSYLSAEAIHCQAPNQQQLFIDDMLSIAKPIYLTLCLDVLNASDAPGVSAPQPLGITPWQLINLAKQIIHTGLVVSIDIAELSPPYDKDERTARLAASIMSELLHCWENRKDTP